MCEKLNHSVPFWVQTFIDNMAHLYLEEDMLINFELKGSKSRPTKTLICYEVIIYQIRLNFNSKWR